MLYALPPRCETRQIKGAIASFTPETISSLLGFPAEVANAMQLRVAARLVDMPNFLDLKMSWHTDYTNIIQSMPNLTYRALSKDQKQESWNEFAERVTQFEQLGLHRQASLGLSTWSDTLNKARLAGAKLDVATAADMGDGLPKRFNPELTAPGQALLLLGAQQHMIETKYFEVMDDTEKEKDRRAVLSALRRLRRSAVLSTVLGLSWQWLCVRPLWNYFIDTHKTDIASAFNEDDVQRAVDRAKELETIGVHPAWGYVARTLTPTASPHPDAPRAKVYGLTKAQYDTARRLVARAEQRSLFEAFAIFLRDAHEYLETVRSVMGGDNDIVAARAGLRMEAYGTALPWAAWGGLPIILNERTHISRSATLDQLMCSALLTAHTSTGKWWGADTHEYIAAHSELHSKFGGDRTLALRRIHILRDEDVVRDRFSLAHFALDDQWRGEGDFSVHAMTLLEIMRLTNYDEADLKRMVLRSQETHQVDGKMLPTDAAIKARAWLTPQGAAEPVLTLDEKGGLAITKGFEARTLYDSGYTEEHARLADVSIPFVAPSHTTSIDHLMAQADTECDGSYSRNRDKRHLATPHGVDPRVIIAKLIFDKDL